MDILYTVDEKYLHALEELQYGELPKAVHLFHDIINADADYARAYYHLGYIYHFYFKNYQSAGYYYKHAVNLDPMFPDTYEPYLQLVITLKMEKLVYQIADKAILVPGVSKAGIYEKLGLYAEEKQDFATALIQYKHAALASLNESDQTLYQDHLNRISSKQNSNQQMVYAYRG